jgi:hypothetical protein
MGDEYRGTDYTLDRNLYPEDEESAALVIAGYPGVTAEDTAIILDAPGLTDRLRARWAGRVVTTTAPGCGPQAGDMAGS